VKKLAYVDPARVGIWGWSYGGYMALYAATHAGEAFKCAVAGAPVVDWSLYDTIYTERYMKLPSENAAGYRASSPLFAADKLATKLLVLHGTSDDNVHFQNTLQLVDAFMRARKDFELVPLPGQKHGPRGAARVYANQRVLEFFEKNL
jgi:dipeptidyl-peptidase-4